MLDAMKPNGTMPEFECFDVGIVRSVNLYVDTGMCSSPHYNFVMGVASGMPCDPDLLPLLLKYRKPDTSWEVTAIGRSEVWGLHRRAAGSVAVFGRESRTRSTFRREVRGNGDLIDAIAQYARDAGRASHHPKARAILGLA